MDRAAGAHGRHAGQRRRPVEDVREQLGGRTLTLGVVPALDATSARARARRRSRRRGQLLRFELPQRAGRRPASRATPTTGRRRSYRQLEPRTDVDLLTGPASCSSPCRRPTQLRMWSDLDPLEAGVGDLPPALDDAALGERVVTWLRVRADGAAQARIRWVGINAVPVRQIERIAVRTAAPTATARPTRCAASRARRCSPGQRGGRHARRQRSDRGAGRQIDDLVAAAARGAGRATRGSDRARAAGARRGRDRRVRARRRGRRAALRRRPARAPPAARARACSRATTSARARPATSPQARSTARRSCRRASRVTNPVRTWGGADAESVATARSRSSRYLQHRDRLVSVDDFESIACRTPGVEIGRVEVLPAFHPDLVPNEPGDAPGVVTLMAIPRFDPGQPDAPRADRLFLNALCRYLDPRRLVTTELVLRGADLQGHLDLGRHRGRGRLRDRRGGRGGEGPAARAARARRSRRARCRATTPLFTPRAHRSRARGWPLAHRGREPRAAGRGRRGSPASPSVADVLLAEGSCAPRADVDRDERARAAAGAGHLGRGRRSDADRRAARRRAARAAPARDRAAPAAGAGRAGDLLMKNVNGTRFHLLLGRGRLGPLPRRRRCRRADARVLVGRRAREPAAAPLLTLPAWDAQRQELTLQPRAIELPATPARRRSTLDARRGAARRPLRQRLPHRRRPPDRCASPPPAAASRARSGRPSRRLRGRSARRSGSIFEPSTPPTASRCSRPTSRSP